MLCVHLKKIQKCLRAEPIITLKWTQHALCTLKEDPKVFKSRANHYFEMDAACFVYCATQPEASEVHRDVYIVDLELIN